MKRRDKHDMLSPARGILYALIAAMLLWTAAAAGIMLIWRYV